MSKMTKITVDVPAGDVQAFSRLYKDFIAGNTPYQAPAERELLERGDEQSCGLDSLQALYAVAQGDSGQCRYIARFLAGLYNGQRFPFDLTDLRGLDPTLFEHCINVLRMDYQPGREVHQYFVDGGTKWEAMIKRWGLSIEQAERALVLGEM